MDSDLWNGRYFKFYAFSGARRKAGGPEKHVQRVHKSGHLGLCKLFDPELNIIRRISRLF